MIALPSTDRLVLDRAYAGHRGGLRLIEVDKGDLVDLPDIAERVEGKPQNILPVAASWSSTPAV